MEPPLAARFKLEMLDWVGHIKLLTIHPHASADVLTPDLLPLLTSHRFPGNLKSNT